MHLLLSHNDIRQLMHSAGEYAVAKYRVERGEDSHYISKNDAYRRYGRACVDKWIGGGLLEVFKDGLNNSRIRVDTLRLKELAAADHMVVLLQKEA